MTQLNHRHRYPILDFIRGQAILLMFIYHICFGLAQAGLLEAQFSSDYFWLTFRTIIIFLFLNLVGIGTFLSYSQANFFPRFIKRMLLLALYAGIITWISFVVRPNHFVQFGILHLIFVSSFLALCFMNLFWFNLVLSMLVLGLGFLVHAPLIDRAYLTWIGFASVRVYSDDFAPLFPWFGFVLSGLFCAQAIFKQNYLSASVKPFVQSWRPRSALSRLFCWSGRHSLHLYFIHFAGFYMFLWLISNL